jgi:DNA-binding NarL/FixJ family response regulator
MISPCRIVLADDHVLVRQGIRKLIEESPELQVVGEASDGSELLELLRNVKADLAILDITMPNISGIELTGRIKAVYPTLKVLILTMHKGKELLEHAIAAGADGYLLKEDAPTELLEAIRIIGQGQVYLSPLMVPLLKEAFVLNHRKGARSALLSGRETEVLKLIAEGKSGKEIAAILHLSVRTVDNHRANIMRKLHVSKSADLVRLALSMGYIQQ